MTDMRNSRKIRHRLSVASSRRSMSPRAWASRAEFPQWNTYWGSEFDHRFPYLPLNSNDSVDSVWAARSWWIRRRADFVVDLQTGDILFSEGDPAQGLFVVMEGELVIFEQVPASG